MAIKVDGTAVTGLPAGWPGNQTLDPSKDQPEYVSGAAGAIKAFDAVGSGSTAGDGYTNGTYEAVALRDGSGTNAIAKLVIASGKLSTITIVNKGSGYKDDEELTFLDADVGGGGGSGGKCKINGVEFSGSGPTTGTTDKPPKYTTSGFSNEVLRTLDDQSKILFYVVDNGTGGGSNGSVTEKSVTGGSGSGLKVDLTIAGNVVTKAVLKTAGTGYKDGDIVTVGKSDSGTTDDVKLRISNPFTVINVGIKDNGGTKSGLADKSDVATTAAAASTGSGLKVNLFKDSGSGSGNPQFVRATVEAAGSGYRPNEEVTVAKSTAGTDNDVKLIVY